VGSSLSSERARYGACGKGREDSGKTDRGVREDFQRIILELAQLARTSPRTETPILASNVQPMKNQKFTRPTILGDLRAEADGQMLRRAFLETADYRTLIETSDRPIVVGRRGTGKSALASFIGSSAEFMGELR
jgi:hypothetical protein